MRTPRFRPARKIPIRVLLTLALVAVVTTPIAAPPNAGLPIGAVASAPVQHSGSATDPVGPVDTTAKQAGNPRNQPRPPGAVADQASAVLPVRVQPPAPVHSKPVVQQHFTGPAIDPKATVRPQDATASTDTFQNPDGSRTLRVYTQPHNARQADGGWVPVDDTLVPDGNRLRPRVAGTNVDFATSASDSDLARITYDATHSASYGLDGAAAVPAKASGTTATYAQVLPGVDVRLIATPSGLDEQLVLAGPSAPASYGYTLKLAGLEPRLTATGDVQLVDGIKIIGVLPAGQMWDSAATSAHSDGVHFGLAKTGPGTWKFTVDVDTAWLRDPARVYPVTIDPSAATPAVNGDDTYVSTGGSPVSDKLFAGKVNGSLNRIYLHLGNALSGLQNDFIIGGALNLKQVDATAARGMQVDAFEVNQSWSGHPGWPGPAVGRYLGQSAPIPSSSAANWDPVQLDATILGDWTHGTALGNGISLRSANESAANGVMFESTRNGDQSQVPYLDIRWAPEGATYAVTDVLQPTANTAGWMNVDVTNRGSTAFDNNYRFGYWVEQANKLYKDFVMPSVAPGATVHLVHVPIDPLTPGKYTLHLSMWDPSGRDFAVQDGVPNALLSLDVDDVAPTSNYQQPAAGDVVQTATPTLYAQGIDPDGWPADATLTYKFRLCANSQLVDQQNFPCLQTDDWGPDVYTPPAGKLFWGTTYYWGVMVNDSAATTPCWVGPEYLPRPPDADHDPCVIVADSPRALRFTPQVPQPEITSHLAGSPDTTEGPGLDPQIGNYSMQESDASAAAAGPPLAVGRTYNSLDPRTDTAFGLGWASGLDMKLTADIPPDATTPPDPSDPATVVLTEPDGRQLRFGRNPDDSYSSPAGESTQLVRSNGLFVLRTSSGGQWLFNAAGRLVAVIDASGLRQNLDYLPHTNFIAAITNALTAPPDSRTTDRKLTLTWGDGKHVTAIAEPSPAPGQPAPTWTYHYDGDRLASVCAPGAAPNCTQYGYTGGSHYRSSVVDDGPVAYYRFNEQPNGVVTVGSAVATHPGGEDAVAHSTATGALPGPLTGTSDGAAAFEGSGYVDLPAGLTADTMSPTAELWFKTTGTGTLLALQDQDFAPGNAALKGTRVLYVGTDGLLYGGFPTQDPGGGKQIVSQVTVNDGSWHHIVLSAATDTQTLYLDGGPVGSVGGVIDQKQFTSAVLGAGRATGQPASDDGDFPLTGGSIDEAALYQHTLGPLAVAEHFASARNAASELTSITQPQDNRGFATLTYDDLSDRASTLVDHNGLKWTMDVPTMAATPDPDAPKEHPRFIDPIRTAVLHGPAGHGTWTYTFDAAAGGRLLTHTHDGATRHYDYNTSGFLAKTVDEDGYESDQTTDPRGNVLSKTSCRAQPKPNAPVCATSYYSYYTPAGPLDPRADKLKSSSDARSKDANDTTYRTSYTYDAAGHPTGTTSPAPNGSGQTTVSTKIDYSTGQEAAFEGGGLTVPAGLPIRVTGARGQVTASQYFSTGDLAETDAPGQSGSGVGLRTRHTYDGLGRTLTTSTIASSGAAYSTTSVTYTPLSQVATTTGPAVTNPVTGAVHAQVATFAYDGDRNATSVTLSDTLPVAQGGDQPRVTTTNYDAHDRPVQITYPDQGVVKYGYSADALTTTTTDVRGFAWAQVTDALGRPTVTTVSGDGVDAQSHGPATLATDTRTYTAAGRLATDQDAMGRLTTYGYLTDGLPATTTVQGVGDADGPSHAVVTASLGYDPAGHVTSETTPGSVTTTTSYDAAGLPLTTTFDPANLKRTTTYTRDPDGNPVSVVTGGAANPDQTERTDYSYDPLGQVSQERAERSPTSLVTTNYHRDDRGLLTEVDDRLGYPTTYTYDATGAVVTTAGPATDVWTAGVKTRASGVETLGRNAFGEVTQSKDATGGVSTTVRDAMGRVASGALPPYTPPGSTTPITATSSTVYDKAGNPVRQTDPLGRVTTTAYDPFNRVAKVTAPQVDGMPSDTSYTYDRMGEPNSVTTPSGAEQQFTYDQLGRQITSTQVDDSSGQLAFYPTVTGYDDAGNAKSVRTPMGETTLTSYDAAGSPVHVTDPTGRVTSYGYDNAGRSASVTAPTGLTSATGYDLLGRATTLTQSSAGKPLRTTTIGYDDNGNMTSTLSPEQRLTTMGYDELNRPVSQQEKVDATHTITTSTGYDILGDKSHAVDGDGHATEYTSNPWGMPESTILPATTANPGLPARTSTTSYDAAGQPVRQTEPGGIVRTRTFDAQGNLRVETGAGAEASTSDRTLDYDPDGNLAAQTSASGTTAYKYDDRGNLLSYTGPVTSGVYSYNGDNELTGRTDAAGSSTFGYDPAGRLASVVDPVTQRTENYGYDPGGRLGAVTDTTSSKTVARTIGYDSLDRVTSDQLAQTPDPGMPPVTKIGQTYSYDLDDHVTGQTNLSTGASADNTYTYDGAGRLSTWTDPSSAKTTYGWDDAGNRTSAGGQTYTYDQRNELLSGGGATYAYTARGTEASATQSGQTTTSQFDAFDRQVQHGQAQYGYDSLDRAESRNGANIGYDGLSDNQVSVDSRVIERLPDGSPLSDKASGQSTPGKQIFADQHGDVVGRYLGGSVDGRKTYDPFGTVTASSGETSSLGFQGSYTDPGTGQVDMAARWYTPSTGRFASSDSVDVSTGPSFASNKYAYANADPVSLNDPTGHQPSWSDCLSEWDPITRLEEPEDWFDRLNVLWDLGEWSARQFDGESACTPVLGNDDCPHCLNVCNDGSVVAYFQSCADRPVDWCEELHPGCHAPTKQALVPPGGGLAPVRTRPPVAPKPPPPLWWINIGKHLDRRPPGTTIDQPLPKNYPTTPPPENVRNPGDDITNQNTKVTQGPKQLFNAQNALPGYDSSQDEDDCVNGNPGRGTIWYAPLESGTWKDDNGAPVINPRTKDDTFERAPGAAACLTTIVSHNRNLKDPDGFDKNNDRANQRGHLIAHAFGGSGKRDNLTPINGAAINNTLMNWGAEALIRAQLKKTGVSVYYRVTPIYPPNSPIPDAIEIHARGSNGFKCDLVIRNVNYKDSTAPRCTDNSKPTSP